MRTQKKSSSYLSSKPLIASSISSDCDGVFAFFVNGSGFFENWPNPSVAGLALFDCSASKSSKSSSYVSSILLLFDDSFLICYALPKVFFGGSSFFEPGKKRPESGVVVGFAATEPVPVAPMPDEVKPAPAPVPTPLD